MNNIFEGAKFGDEFIDREGKRYCYHYKDAHKSSSNEIWTYHYLMREPELIEDWQRRKVIYAPYKAYVFKDGYGVPENLKYSEVEQLLESPNAGHLIVGRHENIDIQNKDGIELYVVNTESQSFLVNTDSEKKARELIKDYNCEPLSIWKEWFGKDAPRTLENIFM